MPLLHRMLAVVLLLAYASTGTAIFPSVAAFLADLDGGHAVIVCRTENGTQVFLHHRPGEFTPEIADHSQLLGRMMVRLCKPSAEGDHRLSTAALADASSNSSPEPKLEPKETAEADASPGMSFLACRPVVLTAVMQAENSLDPPFSPNFDVHRAIRTVRLLI